MVDIRKSLGTLLNILIVLYVLLMTGSAFQNAYMSKLSQVNMMVAFGLLVLIVIIYRGKFRKCRINAVHLFIINAFVNMLICMAIWGEADYYNLYLCNISVFVVSIIVVHYVDYHEFVKQLINVTVLLAIISLVGFYTNFLEIIPAFSLEGTFNYKSYYIYNVLVTNPERNCGFFWEPGMYQGILVISMLLIVMHKERVRYWLPKLLILALTTISTYSTTGYALLLSIGVLLFIDTIDSVSKIGANIMVAVICLILLFVSNSGLLYDFFIQNMPSIVTDKIVNKNISYNTRMYSVFYDLILAIRYPLGVGRLALSDLVKSVAMEVGTVIAARTNAIGTAFVHCGVIGGSVYFYIWLKGLLNLDGSIVKRILILTIALIIINTEPHLYTLLFNILVLYWFNHALGKERMDDEHFYKIERE